MVVTESCENNVAVSNNGLDGHGSGEDSSNGTMSNKVVSQHPERIDETKECLVQRKVSLRFQNRAKVEYGSGQKRSMSDENKSDKKKTKLNAGNSKSDTCSSSGSVVAGGDGLVSNYTNAFPQGMNITAILRLKEILRLLNLKKLQSEEEEQNRCKINEENNNMGAAEPSRRKIRSSRGQEVLTEVPSRYPWFANSKQGYNFLSLVYNDISNDQEDLSIPIINEYDVPPIAPAGKFNPQVVLVVEEQVLLEDTKFTYIKSLQISKNVKVPSIADGCRCKGSCTRTRTCACIKLNGSSAYDSRHGGRMIGTRKDVIFECGPSCACGPDCGNRVSQKGLKYQLEVFRTPNKGWGVRTFDNIPAGAPVCEYIGVLSRSDELENVTNNEYIFDIDCRQTINRIERRERQLGSVSLPASSSDEKMDDKIAETDPEFCIDGGSFGNVARFINHSCDPNLFVQGVLSSHHDIKQARVVLFAATKIRPYEELTYDYGYKLDSVIDPDGNIKQLACNCGEANCRKRLY